MNVLLGTTFLVLGLFFAAHVPVLLGLLLASASPSVGNTQRSDPSIEGRIMAVGGAMAGSCQSVVRPLPASKVWNWPVRFADACRIATSS